MNQRPSRRYVLMLSVVAVLLRTSLATGVLRQAGDVSTRALAGERDFDCTTAHPFLGGDLRDLIYDMSGNVFEWCQDTCADDITAVPQDGTPYLGPGSDRRLRGGSHTNWDLHCRVWWRYGIAQDAHDGCIGFRLVLASG